MINLAALTLSDATGARMTMACGSRKNWKLLASTAEDQRRHRRRKRNSTRRKNGGDRP
jgi:hypothetical protein